VLWHGLCGGWLGTPAAGGLPWAASLGRAWGSVADRLGGGVDRTDRQRRHPPNAQARAFGTRIGAMTVAETIPKALKAVAKLKASSAANEANTKAHVIEPILSALGWDPLDIDSVVREVKVYDGTFLDYALKLSGTARIYVEAKGLGENLDDKKFMAQAINYANNDGVLWCVLTNGVRWSVYKTNEPVTMDRKLLLEIDLAEEADSTSEKAKLLSLISREAVEAGDLDNFGDRVFTDARVRAALESLALDSPDTLVHAISSRLEAPDVQPAAIRRSLARVLDFKLPAETGLTKPSEGPKHVVGPSTPPKSQEYDIDHHLGGKSALIRELFEELDKLAPTLGPDVSRRIRKQYVGYFRGKRSFFTAETQKQRIIVYLGLDPKAWQPWNSETMRDTTDIGHFGMGDLEYSLRATDQLDELRVLISAAYEAS
jgi:predicted transport protein